MKAIFTILIFLIIGVIIGVVTAKFINRIMTYFLKKKINKLALASKKAFSYKETPYDIKTEIEKQQAKNKKGLFKKKLKGGESQNGNSVQSRGEGTTETTNERNSETSSNEYTNQTTTEERGSERGTTRTFSRNLSFKARKFD